jgi:ISXO2-like transposase domain
MHWSSAAGMKSRWPVFRAGTGSIGTDPRTARFTPTRFDGEGFWSIIKRGVLGTFHKVSKKYIPLYVAEFQFRHDNRMTLEKSVAQI